jgi:hypothetical protein
MKIGATFLIVILMFMPAGGLAQEDVSKDAGFGLISDPPGATAYLNGEYKLIVNTPARLPGSFVGKYKAKITRQGYEQWKGDLSFVPGQNNDINVKLKKKTAFKAGIRSLFLPGWGQFYSGSKTRGSFITLGAIAAAGGLYAADKRYQDRRADYDIAAQAYSDARSIDERIRLKTIKDAMQRKAYSAETDRRTIFFMGVGLWAYNVVDAVIFFPGGEAYLPAVSAIDGGVKFSFSMDF